MAWGDREGWLNFAILGDGRVEHMKQWQQRRWGNHHEKLGLKRSSCASQFTIPDTADNSPHPPGNNTDMRSSKNNQASCTPYFSGPLLYSISFSSSSPVSLFLVHNSTIIARTQSSVIPLYLSLPSSGVNTECSVRRMLHTPTAAYTSDCLSSLHSLDFELTPECSFSFWRTSLQIDCHRPVLHNSFTGKVTSSHSHGFKSTNQRTESQHLVRLQSTASRSSTSTYSSDPPRS